VKRIKWVVGFLVALGLSSVLYSALAVDDWDDCLVVNPIRLCQEK
jgi:hypothetical protein